MNPIQSLKIENLRVQVYSDRGALGRAAGTDVAAIIAALQSQQQIVRMIFAAAPSQNEMLDTLVAAKRIDWTRVHAFHMDEYIGLDAAAPQRFGRYLSDRIFNKVRPGRVHLIASFSDAAAECRRYAALLREAPIDIVCLGIGENGHIAFNDPPVADFNDRDLVKVVELDQACRQQQVNDGCFASIDRVPTHALTLTIPALMSGRRLFCCVPGPTKRNAVRRTLNGPIATECPATILRRHNDCTLYVDTGSYGG